MYGNGNRRLWKKNVPLLTSQFKITDGYIAYEGMPSRIEELNTDFFARIDLQREETRPI